MLKRLPIAVLRPGSRSTGRLAGAGLVLSTFGVVSGGCARETRASEDTVVLSAQETFTVIRPTMMDTKFERAYVGEVRAVEYAEIRSRTEGIIQSIGTDDGQWVRRGQVLFTLGAQELSHALREAQTKTMSARAELEVAQVEVRSTQVLFEKNVVSEVELDLARSKARALQTKVAESEAQEQRAAFRVQFSRIQAPFDGLVNRITYRVGNLVGEDTLLTTIANTEEVFVYFRMSELDYLIYVAAKNDEQHQVHLRLVDGSTFPHAGTIDTSDSEFDKTTGTIAFRARFHNPDRLLKHGSSAEVVLDQQLRNVLVVPQKSTFEVQGNLYVYVLDEQNVPRARRITPRARLRDEFVVEAGLEASDRFVAEGVQRIREGNAIGVVEET